MGLRTSFVVYLGAEHTFLEFNYCRSVNKTSQIDKKFRSD